MTLIEITQPDAAQREAIRALWNREYPDIIFLPGAEDLERYLAPLDDHLHLLLTDDNGNLRGWLFLFERGGEQWFAMIVEREWQGRGYGSRLLKEAKLRRHVLNGWVIDSSRYLRKDGSSYPVPLDFYLKNGFAPHPEQRLEEPFSATKIVWHKYSY